MDIDMHMDMKKDMKIALIGPFPLIIWKSILSSKNLNKISDIVKISLTCKSLYNLIWKTPNFMMLDPKFNLICPVCQHTFYEALRIYSKLQHNIYSFFSQSNIKLPSCYLPIILNTDKCPCLYCKEFTENVVYKQLEHYNKYDIQGALIFSLSSFSSHYSNINNIVLAVRYVKNQIRKKSLIQIKFDPLSTKLSFCVLLPNNFSTNSYQLLLDKNIYYDDWDLFLQHEFDYIYQYNLYNLGQIYVNYKDSIYSEPY